jgi:predicted secreted hydrolase
LTHAGEPPAPPPSTPSVTPSTTSSPWLRAINPRSWVFPRDHGAHPDFKTEWWYFTGNLQDVQQRKFGYQLTVFRQGIQFTPAQTQSQWAVRDIYFGHFTVSDIANNSFHVAEKVSRGALGGAKAATGRMDVALGAWTIQQDADEKMHLVARDLGMAIDLTETPAKPLVLEGVGGLSRKAQEAGDASYYYSYPRLATTGSVQLGDGTHAVSGLSWFDHEFSTSSLSDNEVGWDWFCLQLDDREEIMLYSLRDKSGAIDPASEGTWVNADGTSQRLPPGSFTIEKRGTWTSSRSGAVYPAGWHILVPGHQADLTVQPSMADQELRLSKLAPLNYWEGACTIVGSVGGKQLLGVGYTELTGYAGAIGTGMKD